MANQELSLELENEIDYLLEKIDLFVYRLKERSAFYDESELHVLEDDINSLFINMLANPRTLSIEKIQEIAKIIKENVNEAVYSKWYS